MKPEMLSVGRLVLCAIDVFTIYLFFKSMFELRKGRTRQILFSVLATFAVFITNAFGNSWLNLMIVPIVCLLYTLVVFRLSFLQGLAYIIIFYAIFAGGREVAYELLLRLVSSYLPFALPLWFTSDGFYFLIPEYLLSFMFLLLIIKSTKKLQVNENQEFAWYLLIMPVSSMIVLSGFLYMDFPESVIIQRLMCFGAFMLYFSNAAIFLILAKYTGIMNQMKYEEMSTMKQTMEDDKYQKIARLNDHYREYMHDMHNHLSQLRSYAINDQQQKIIQMIDELEGKMENKNSTVLYSGNPVLDTILTERTVKAENEGIELTIFVEKFLKLDFIADTDMISMFGNLLDNALEAAAQCENGNRKVDVKLFMGNQYMLVLHIENTFRYSAKREGNRLMTTKKDTQFHGLGIGIVKKLAEKYGGDLSLEECGNIFKTSLIISACSKQGCANFGRESV